MNAAGPYNDVMTPGIFCSSLNVSSALISDRRIIIVFNEFTISIACPIIPLCQIGINRFIHLVSPLNLSNLGRQSSCHARRAKVGGFIEGVEFCSPEFQ